MNVVNSAPQRTGLDGPTQGRDPWDAGEAAAEDESGALCTAEDKASAFEHEALPQLDILYRVALRLAGEPAEAEDLVQQAMLKAYHAWGRYQPGTNIRAWLLTILRNEAFMAHRRRKRTRRALESGKIEWADFERGYENDPESRFFDRHVDDEIVRAVDSLPVEFREAVVLRYVESLSYAEIAQITGVRIGTVKSRLFRARQILKRQLQDYAARMEYVRPRGPHDAGEAGGREHDQHGDHSPASKNLEPSPNGSRRMTSRRAPTRRTDLEVQDEKE